METKIYLRCTLFRQTRNAQFLGEENSFVQAGEEIFAVLPALNPVIAQVLIPSMGAGKVALGQEVIIKLDDFPYMEFGTVAGKVKKYFDADEPPGKVSWHPHGAQR